MAIQNQDAFDTALMSVEQTAQYLGIGVTKTRELFKKYESVFVIPLGKRKYAHRELLDKWLKGQVRRKVV